MDQCSLVTVVWHDSAGRVGGGVLGRLEGEIKERKWKEKKKMAQQDCGWGWDGAWLVVASGSLAAAVQHSPAGSGRGGVWAYL